MPLPALPEGYLLRPAVAADRRQIHRLLQNFERETDRPMRRWQFLGWSVVAAVLLWMMVTVGVAVVLLAIVALSSSLFWIQISPLISNDWKQYWVIVDCFAVPRSSRSVEKPSGKLIACGKLCRYRHYSLLFNLLVAPAYRHRGFGSILVDALSQKAVKPLYLACHTNRVSFYTRLRFEPIAVKELPASVRNALGITPRSKLLALKLDR